MATDPEPTTHNPSPITQWAESYARAWVELDPEAAADLFSEDASYRSFIFDEPHVGRDGVRAYWSEVTATQAEVHVTMGRPIVDGPGPRRVLDHHGEFGRGGHAGRMSASHLR